MILLLGYIGNRNEWNRRKYFYCFGAAVANKKQTVLITGDIVFFMTAMPGIIISQKTSRLYY
jgi:exopolysaccharide biosynthesis predicted pyruvyltransferase EpsI